MYDASTLESPFGSLAIMEAQSKNQSPGPPEFQERTGSPDLIDSIDVKTWNQVPEGVFSVILTTIVHLCGFLIDPRSSHLFVLPH